MAAGGDDDDVVPGQGLRHPGQEGHPEGDPGAPLAGAGEPAGPRGRQDHRPPRAPVDPANEVEGLAPSGLAVDHEVGGLPRPGSGEDRPGVLGCQDQGRDPEGRRPGRRVEGDGLVGRAVRDEDEARGAGSPDSLREGRDLGLPDARPAAGGQVGHQQGTPGRILPGQGQRGVDPHRSGDPDGSLGPTLQGHIPHRQANGSEAACRRFEGLPPGPVAEQPQAALHPGAGVRIAGSTRGLVAHGDPGFEVGPNGDQVRCRHCGGREEGACRRPGDHAPAGGIDRPGCQGLSSRTRLRPGP